MRSFQKPVYLFAVGLQHLLCYRFSEGFFIYNQNFDALKILSSSPMSKFKWKNTQDS